MHSSTLEKRTGLAANTLNDPRWADVASRNVEADGKFYYAVKTTGVYCRPSYAARLALPQNVSFYGSREEAEKAGFSPCKRCQPHGRLLASHRIDALSAMAAGRVFLASTLTNNGSGHELVGKYT